MRFKKMPLPFSHTVRRRTVRKSEVTEMPSLPRGGGDDLVRDEQVSSRRVGHGCYRTRLCFSCLTALVVSAC